MANQSVLKRKRERYLSFLRKGEPLYVACQRAGLSSTSMRRLYRDDPEWAKRVDDAIEDGTDSLESVGIKRARSKSDLLMMFFLKAKRPNTYREQTSLVGKDGGPATIQIVSYRDGKTIDVTPHALPAIVDPGGGKTGHLAIGRGPAQPLVEIKETPGGVIAPKPPKKIMKLKIRLGGQKGR